MKNLVLLCFGLMVGLNIQSQIRLSSELVDSIICNIEVCPPEPDFTNSRLILNLASLPPTKHSIYYSSTLLVSRQDINKDMMIYINDVDLYFVLIKDVLLDSSFIAKLVPFNNPRFNRALDSINFPHHPMSGVSSYRSPLVVYRIKRRFISNNTYTITSRSYIPYLSAPEVFIPLKEVSDGHLYHEIEPWYYDRKPFKELNAKYYEDMKPSEKIILRMPKK